MLRLTVVGLLAVAVALSGTPAFADVQNIRVSGDIDLKAVGHYNYDLKDKQGNIPGGGAAPPAAPAITNDDDANFFLSTTRVRVDADLTDNVSATVRLLNQRFWDTDVDATNNVDIDNAYVVLKEFFYSPLTVIVGKQDLNYGAGFIVGSGLLGDPNGTFGGAAIGVGSQTQIGQEFSAYNSYDAIRMIFDYSPLTVEGLIAKINESGVSGDDHDLYGVYITYKLDQWQTQIEPYWFYKSNEGNTFTVSDDNRVYENNYVHTIGTRVALSPMENFWLNLEGAYQTGELQDDGAGFNAARERDREGFAANIEARYTWATVPWTPTTGVGWVFYSGEDSSTQAGQTPNATGSAAFGQGTDDFDAWDPMYRGNFFTYIQEFLGGNDAVNLYATFDNNDTAANTNRHLIFFDVGAKAMEDLALWARYTHARFAEEPRSGRSSHAGDELDVKAIYDYTEDVQLGLWGAWFFPGAYYDEPASSVKGDDLAWTIGGSAAVKF